MWKTRLLGEFRNHLKQRLLRSNGGDRNMIHGIWIHCEGWIGGGVLGSNTGFQLQASPRQSHEALQLKESSERTKPRAGKTLSDL